jgi:hypothetical protein
LFCAPSKTTSRHHTALSAQGGIANVRPIPTFHQTALDNYEIIKTIGTGSSAVVKMARRLADSEIVAIKVSELFSPPPIFGGVPVHGRRSLLLIQCGRVSTTTAA